VSAHPSTRVREGDGGQLADGNDAADPFASGRVGVEAVVSGETTETAEAAQTSRRNVEVAVREEMQRRLAEEVAAAHKKAAREAAMARRKAQQEVEKVRVRSHMLFCPRANQSSLVLTRTMGMLYLTGSFRRPWR
jgi:hypothetical protein